jgi:hypothetical protein
MTTDAVRHAPREVRGHLAPERVVPAELARPHDGMLLEGGDVGTHFIDVLQALAHVVRAVIGNTRPHTTRMRTLDQLLDRERAVGKGGVGVAVERLPAHGLGGLTGGK